MKKIIILSFLFIPLSSFTQKNNNGKVYDTHPAIDKVNKFTSAWISGDTETLKSLTGDDFKMGSSMNNNPNYKGGDINNLVGQSRWMSKNFVNISFTILFLPKNLSDLLKLFVFNLFSKLKNS